MCEIENNFKYLIKHWLLYTHILWLCIQYSNRFQKNWDSIEYVCAHCEFTIIFHLLLFFENGEDAERIRLFEHFVWTYVCVCISFAIFWWNQKCRDALIFFVTTITFALVKSFRISNSAKKLMENTFHKGTRLSLRNLVYLHYFFSFSFSLYISFNDTAWKWVVRKNRFVTLKDISTGVVILHGWIAITSFYFGFSRCL